MSRTSERWRRRLPWTHLDDEGASLVEFALVIPLFLLLLCAMVDFGLAFAGDTQLRGAVNAGARNAAISGATDTTYSVTCPSGAPAMYCTILDRIGNPPGIVPGSVEVAISLPDGTTVGTDPVLVCAQATLKSATGFTGFLMNGRTIRVTSELLLEQPPAYGSYNPYPGSLSC